MSIKITAEKTWEWSAIRSMCIENHYYTCGDNEDYNKLYEFIKNHKPTSINIYWVAEDIARHSDLSRYRQTEKENIESIMYAIANDCVTTFYEIEE